MFIFAIFENSNKNRWMETLLMTLNGQHIYATHTHAEKTQLISNLTSFLHFETDPVRLKTVLFILTNRRKDPHSRWTSQPDPRQPSLFVPRHPQHTVCSPQARPAPQVWARAASRAPSQAWAETPLWVGNQHLNAVQHQHFLYHWKYRMGHSCSTTAPSKTWTLLTCSIKFTWSKNWCTSMFSHTQTYSTVL